MQNNESEVRSNWKPIWATLGPLILVVMGVDVYFRTRPSPELMAMAFMAPVLFALVLGFNNKINFKTNEFEYKTLFYWKQISRRIISYNDIEKIWVQRHPLNKSKLLAFGTINKGKNLKIINGRFLDAELIIKYLETYSGRKKEYL
jgi:hypothetical protein